MKPLLKLKVKKMNIEAGDILVCVLNKNDAKLLDLRALDRVKIKKDRKIETVIIDIADSKKTVPKGCIGVFNNVFSLLKLKEKEVVEVIPTRRPLSLEYIKKKLDGKKLSKKEIYQIVWDIVHNKLSEVELSYFVAACYTKTMDLNEVVYLTKAMAVSSC